MRMTSESLAHERRFIAAGGSHSRHSRARAAYDSAAGLQQGSETGNNDNATTIGKIIGHCADKFARGELDELIAGLQNLAMQGAEDAQPDDGESLLRALSDQFFGPTLAVIASGHEQPISILQQLARGDPSGRDDVREISAVAAQR